MFQQTIAEINLNHLQHNWQVVKQAMGSRFICPMVKAFAYGHDDVLISRSLAQMGCENFGVCLIDEGIKLRQHGLQKKILVFRPFDQAGLNALLEHQLTPVVSGWDQIEVLKIISSRLSGAQASPRISLHLKFDTGMQRLGFSVQDAEKLKAFFEAHKIFQVEGVMTHLSSSELSLVNEQVTKQQLDDLSSVKKFFSDPQIIFHCLNSGGIISELTAQKNSKNQSELFRNQFGARPGIMIYGYNPGVPAPACELKPVMKVKSHPLALRKVRQGQGVSYNHRWKASKDSTIAVIPMGYGDGYPRQLTNRAQVLYQGQLVHQVGTVCMDYLMIDVTEVEKNPERQDLAQLETVLWGDPRLTADAVAAEAQTISYEILTRLSPRVPRVPIKLMTDTQKDSR